MASRSANIVFDILAKDNASKVFDSMSDKLSKQEKAISGLRTVGTAQFVALAASAAIFAKKSIDSASDLSETVNMGTVIFGDQASAMEDWAKTADRSAGLSEQAALQAASSFGDMFTQLGFAGDQAAQMSQSTVQLAADLGSFRNLDTEDVLTRISAATRGEYDSIRLLIPNISAARVEQEALATTGKKAAAELTAQEKVTATLAVIQRDAASATGDFARTSDGLANQQKALRAATENMAAEVGEHLLPVALEMTAAALDTLTWMGDHETAATALAITIGTLSTAIALAANWQKIQTTASTIAVGAEWAWGAAKTASNAITGRAIPIKAADAAATDVSTAAIGRLSTATAVATATTSANTVANKSSTSSLGKLSKGAGVAAAAMAFMAVGAPAMQKWGLETQQSAGVSTEALLDLADGAEIADTSISKMFDRGGFADWFTGNDIASVDEAFRNLTASSTNEQIDNVLSSVLSLGQSTSTARLQSEEFFKTVDEGLTSLVASGNEAEASNALARIADEAGISVEELTQLLPGYTDALAGVASQERLSADATDDTTTATDASAEAASEAADEVLSLVDALKEQIDTQREAAGVVLDERSALRDYRESIDAISAALEENGATLDVNTQQGRNNQAALDNIASSTWDLIDSNREAGQSQQVLADNMATGRQAFIDAAGQMGLTTDQAKALADQMGLIPTDVVMNMSLQGYPEVYKYISNIAAGLRAVSGDKSIRIATGLGGSGGQTFAGGGEVWGAGTSTSDSIAAFLSDGEFVHTAQAHQFWGSPAMHAMNNRDALGLFKAISAKGFAGGGAASQSVFASRSVASPYVGISQTPGVASSGAAVFNIYDADGALLGAMRGVAVEQSRSVAVARTASTRRP